MDVDQADDAAAALAEVGLPDALDWEVARLSTGEKQRLALLRLLANQPRALLLDEPTASLDPRKVEDLLHTYRQQHAAPVLWVSHDPAQRQRVAQRVLELKEGVVREIEP